MSDIKEFLIVPYGDKDEAKTLGARWDTNSKRWYVPQLCSDNNSEELTARWGSVDYINVSYDDRAEVKALGAQWDGSAKKWYVPKGSPNFDLMLKKWKNAPRQPAAAAAASMDDCSFINIAYSDQAGRNEAKSLGARWSGDAKKWYVLQSNPNYDQIMENWGTAAATNAAVERANFDESAMGQLDIIDNLPALPSDGGGGNFAAV